MARSPRALAARLLGERVEEHTADAHGAAEELDWLERLAEGEGDADDDDGALGGVCDGLGGGGGLLDREGGKLVVEVEVEARGDEVAAQDGRLLEERSEVAEAARLGRKEEGEDAEGSEDRRDGELVAGRAERMRMRVRVRVASG